MCRIFQVPYTIIFLIPYTVIFPIPYTMTIQIPYTVQLYILLFMQKKKPETVQHIFRIQYAFDVPYSIDSELYFPVKIFLAENFLSTVPYTKFSNFLDISLNFRLFFDLLTNNEFL